jgi:hypothetical protein
MFEGLDEKIEKLVNQYFLLIYLEFSIIKFKI